MNEEKEGMIDVLKEISRSLKAINENLDLLAKCITYIPPREYQKEGYHVFRIGGQVEAE